jgi:cobalt-zinc-cadmium efflux system outer membrane protein
VKASFSRLAEAEREYEVSQQSFNKDFPEVNRSVIENFNKGNISLLEFIDFFENYNSAIRQVNQLQKQRRLAWEELEYTVGTAL